MRTGIIGASGIGKHHGKWFHQSGRQVVAFTGTSVESCERTAAALRDLFGFDGRYYTNYRRMIEKEALDIISICSPPEAHLAQIRDALDAGIHVYCEKPVTWVEPETLNLPLESRPHAELRAIAHPGLDALLRETQAALKPALEGRSVFGLNTQYVAAQETYRSIYETEVGALDRIETVYFLLESKGVSGRHNSFEGIWIDMAPHAMSQLIAWLPEKRLFPENVDCRILENETTAVFSLGSARVAISVRKNVRSVAQRRFGVNGFLVDYEGRADERGVYRSVLRYGEREVMIDDLVQISIQRFLEALNDRRLRPLAGPEEALRNLELSMMILERGARTPGHTP